MKERALYARNFKFSTLEREGNWSRNVSQNCLWDRCWWRTGLISYPDLSSRLRLRKKRSGYEISPGQLLTFLLPVLSNSTRSLTLLKWRIAVNLWSLADACQPEVSVFLFQYIPTQPNLYC